MKIGWGWIGGFYKISEQKKDLEEGSPKKKISNITMYKE